MFIGDQACHRSDERAKSAEVGTDDKCLVIRCKSRQQKGGWHVADDLAGTDCNVCFPSGNDAFKEGLESRHALHISDEYEKSDKCAEQCVVHVKQSFSRYKQKQYKNNREQDADVQKFGDIQQAQHKCDAVKDNLFFRKFNRMVVPIDYDRVLFDKEHGDQDSKQRGNRVGEHNFHECTEGHAGLGIQIQVLWIPHRHKHTSEVCSDCLHHNDRDDQMFFLRHGKHNDRKWHKGDQ